MLQVSARLLTVVTRNGRGRSGPGLLNARWWVGPAYLNFLLQLLGKGVLIDLSEVLGPVVSQRCRQLNGQGYLSSWTLEVTLVEPAGSARLGRDPFRPGEFEREARERASVRACVPLSAPCGVPVGRARGICEITRATSCDGRP